MTSANTVLGSANLPPAYQSQDAPPYCATANESNLHDPPPYSSLVENTQNNNEASTIQTNSTDMSIENPSKTDTDSNSNNNNINEIANTSNTIINNHDSQNNNNSTRINNSNNTTSSDNDNNNLNVNPSLENEKKSE